MNNNSSKQILLSVLGVAILVVAVVGVSFAAFTYTKPGTQVNEITTGTIAFQYNESTNIINLVDAMPTDNNTGKALNDADQKFDFDVTSTINGSATIVYSIAVEKIPVEGGDGSSKGSPLQLEDQYVNFYLSETESEGVADKTEGVLKEGYAVTSANAKTGCPSNVMEMKEDSVNTSTTRYYSLRMWLNSKYGSEDENGESFAKVRQYKAKVNVYAKSAVPQA